MNIVFNIFHFLKLVNIRNYYFFLCLIVLAVFTSFVEISLLTTLGLIVSKFSIDSQSSNFSTFYFSEILNTKISYQLMVVIFAISAFLLGVSRIFLLYFINKISFNFGKTLGEKLITGFLTSNYQIVRGSNSSEFISLVANKVNNIVYEIIIPFFNICSSLIILISLTIFTIAVIPLKVLFFISLFGLFYIFIMSYSKGRLSNNSILSSKLSTKKIKVLYELYGHIKEIYLGMMWNERISTYLQVDNKLKHVQLYELMVGHSPKYIIESSMFLLFAYLLYSTNGDAIPIVAIMVVVLQRLLPLVQQCHSSYISILNSSSLLAETDQILSQSNHFEFRGDIFPLRFFDNINLVNLSFTYPNRDLLFSKVNFKIMKGQWIGLIGNSGSGKSTLIDIIMGLLSPTSGDIFIDGVKVGSSNLMSWRINIAHVPQSPYLSDSSLLENIVLNNNDIINSRLLKLSIYCSCLDEFIDSLPGGISSSLGENGSELSGGQRQRLAIARALYSDRDLIVFDESTNALDIATESLILDRIKMHFSHKTVIFISHKAKELKYCDDVYKLSNCQLIKLTNDEI